MVAVAEWLADDAAPAPDRAALAEAVRPTPRTPAAQAPAAPLALRVPPCVAVP